MVQGVTVFRTPPPTNNKNVDLETDYYMRYIIYYDMRNDMVITLTNIIKFLKGI